MIAYIEGQVLFLEAGYAVVKANGVGYHVILGKRDLEFLIVGQTSSFFVHTHVREDAIELYGFSSQLHKQVFLLLIGISGIGPKLGLGILSALSPSHLLSAIIDKDLAKLSSIPGIGKKTSERICLELKDKALKLDIPLSHGDEDDVRKSLEQAIRSLGYNKAQSDRALLGLESGDLATLSLEALIKKTLNVLTGNSAS